jgi:hypothetical protein
MVGGIKHLAEAIKLDLLEALPYQRKTQRENLALLVATMLHVRSANTMDLAAELPLATQRIDMRYQWISRLLSNDFIYPDKIMKPFARQILNNQREKVIVLMIDQTQASKDFQILMVSVRFGQRALPLAWCARKTQGNIGFEDQKRLLDLIASYFPKDKSVVLMGDRFYGTVNLIEYCKQKNWDYRLRLKGNLTIYDGLKEMKAGDLALTGPHFLENVTLTQLREQTNIAIIHEVEHPEAWIIAMKQKPDVYSVFDYGMRWSIEPMFSDFKTRGFGLENTQLRYRDRLERLILVMAIAMIWAVFSGVWDSQTNPLPYEKMTSQIKKLIAA